jgi:hypothetical protein
VEVKVELQHGEILSLDAFFTRYHTIMSNQQLSPFIHITARSTPLTIQISPSIEVGFDYMATTSPHNGSTLTLDFNSTVQLNPGEHCEAIHICVYGTNNPLFLICRQVGPNHFERVGQSFSWKTLDITSSKLETLGLVELVM